MTEQLSKTYETEAVQAEIAELWDRHGAFDAEPDAPGTPYSIVIPPPNVTAALHLGHALNNTLQDVLVRWRRMCGDNAIWLPGTDHAGIATQTVVEKRVLAEEGKRRTDFERDAFVEKIQAWKDEYEATITGQLKAMGCSCDWRRQAFTMDETRAKAVREAFFQLFKDGLIYRGKRLVNWDPATQTALADDEVEMEPIDGHFWYLKYPVVDEHGKETGEHCTVATTRPETMLGDTAVAVNPDDGPRAKFIGQRVKLPIVGRIIPVVGDDYVVKPDPESSDEKAKYASGFLKVTPAHDPNDWEIGQRHDLPVINVMAPDGSISDQHGWEDVGGAEFTLGLDRYEAREAIVTWFRENKLLEDVKPYRHTVGHSYRSHVPVEPYLSDQWYVKVTDERLAGAALKSMAEDQRTADTECVWIDEHPFDRPLAPGSTGGFREDPPVEPGANGPGGGLTFTPNRYARTFQTWHENIRDWCISRQLWWGHRIPVWQKRIVLNEKNWADVLCGQSGLDEVIENKWESAYVVFQRCSDGAIVDPKKDLMPVVPSTEGEYDIYICACTEADMAGFEADGFTRDPDVLDTWFSSALWPLSTLGWPEKTAELETWNPTSVLSTAREIITLWVSRMVMFNQYFRGCVPFTDVFIHAMIQDGEGRKMSKSLGNGVDPLDIIHTHGADAMRFTLVQMTTQTQDVRMPVEPDEATGRNTSPKFDIGRNFCTKMWNAAKFALSHLEESRSVSDRTGLTEPGSLADKWVLSRLAQTISTVDKALGEYQFNAYAQAMYDFFWRDLCDWYLEAIKPTVREDTEEGATARAVLAGCLDAALRLLHPITPFVTEKLFQRLNEVAPRRSVAGLELPASDLCIKAGWPTADASLHNERIEKGFVRLQELVGMIRQVRNDENVPPREVVDVSAKLYEDIADQLRSHMPLVEHLANVKVVAMSTDVERPDNSAVVVRPLAEVYLHKQFDASAELERLTRRKTELEKSRGALSGRLNNKGYVDKAPAHLVEETREQLAQVERELETVAEGLARLG